MADAVDQLRALRTNHTQIEIAETSGCSQPTVSRAVTALTSVLACALARFVPVAEDVDLHSSILIDGTLLPCWSWRDQPNLWSGKHRTTGMNVQVACDLDGRVVWVSDPLPGSTHDLTALRASGLLEGQERAHHLADKGYQGSGLLTPVKKPIGGQLTQTDRAINVVLSGYRSAIERGNAHLKNWKVFHTDYRRPIDTFPETITAVLEAYSRMRK